MPFDLPLLYERKRKLNQKSTLLDKVWHWVGIAGNAVLMNLLFLAPGFATLLLLLVAQYLYSSGLLGNPVLSGIALIIASLPIALMGQSCCGLISGVRYNIRGDKWFAGFKKGFTTRFWRGTIAWCIMLALNVYMLLDVQYAYTNVLQGHTAWAEGYVAQLVFASVILLLSTMVTTSLLMLNVYIPTPIGRWIETAVNMVFKAPLHLLGAAVAFWLPVLLAVLRFDYFWYSLLAFIALYFSLAALIATMLLKNALIDYLVDAREDGVLLAEEGKRRTEDEDEDEEDEENEEEEDEDE